MLNNGIGHVGMLQIITVLESVKDNDERQCSKWGVNSKRVPGMVVIFFLLHYSIFLNFQNKITPVN